MRERGCWFLGVDTPRQPELAVRSEKKEFLGCAEGDNRDNFIGLWFSRGNCCMRLWRYTPWLCGRMVLQEVVLDSSASVSGTSPIF